jgi:superfamily II DNA/RNA helicase
VNTPVITFDELNLPNSLGRALHEINFKKPTPIQEKSIPVSLSGKDLIASAQTGTGKTAAFCIPIAVRLLKELNKTALVLAPTRELALQIEAFWKDLTRFSPDLKAACLIGGASFSAQTRALSKRPRVLIATPGRLLDHLNRRSANISQTAVLVLDEADRMLDMGFAPQLSQILRHLPKHRQTLLFSATWDPAMDKLSKSYLHQPERVTIGTISRAAPTIEQKVVSTQAAKKNETLLDQLNQCEGSVLIFARTQARTDRLARYLNTYGLEVGRLHGGRSQGQRNSALNAFRSGEMRILVATDIAARGIDVAEIAHVINYDLPQAPEDYIHRIGRTGRAGMKGQALSILTPEDRSQWHAISKLLQKSGSTVPQLPATSAAEPSETAPAATRAPQRPHQVKPENPQARAKPHRHHRPHPMSRSGRRSEGRAQQAGY